jgi:hypothetical protein
MAHTPTITDFQLYVATPLTGANWAYDWNKIIAYLVGGTEDFTLNSLTTVGDITCGVGGTITGDGSGITGVLNRVDRGDATAFDFTQADVIIDGAYHDLDCSAIVPATATAIEFTINVKQSAAIADGIGVFLRKKGYTHTFNIAGICPQVINITNTQTMVVACDANRFIQCAITSAFITMGITITAWYI